MLNYVAFRNKSCDKSMAMSKLLKIAILLLSFIFYLCEPRSFTIDYERDCFLKDGKEFRYISGGFHYFRVPRYYWKDRLLKIKSAGLNAVQSYVAWNIHEPSPGMYNFDGDADLLNFIQLVNDTGLLLILRPGPYICAEWDFGGFPSWLLKNSSIILRSSHDKVYIDAVTSWMRVLLPKIKPYLYENGGPIITMQVENEYGLYQVCDHYYLKYLQNLFEEILGKNVILFSVDPPGSDKEISCGTISTLFTTIDFGTGANATTAFELLRKHQTHGPLVNTEFYTGWLDNWGLPHHTLDPNIVADALDKILKLNASVNMYMFEGGTNFGFMNGANYKYHPDRYEPQPTSYDYGAPLSEAGDITKMFFTLREVIGKYLPIPPGPVPPSTPKHAYGKSILSKAASLADLLNDFKRYSWHQSKYPLTMEQMGLSYGFVLYKTSINFQGNTTLDVSGVRDRAVVYCDKMRQGIVSRNKPTQISTQIIGCSNLLILVENQGRINYGAKMRDPKGIIQNVTANGRILINWDMAHFIPDDKNTLFFSNRVEEVVSVSGGDNIADDTAGLFHGIIPPMPDEKNPQDSYLLLKGWHKGQVYINDFNLGRYWPVKGPQVTLYVPATVFRTDGGDNTIIVFELDEAPCDQQHDTCYVEFTTTPILNGPTIFN